MNSKEERGIRKEKRGKNIRKEKIGKRKEQKTGRAEGENVGR